MTVRLSKKNQRRALKVGTFAVLLMPLLYLAYQWHLLLGNQPNSLGFEPIDYTVGELGQWALRILILALAMTPLRRLTGRSEFIQIRRMVGLFAFFYVLVDLTTYVWVDIELNLSVLWEDIVKRKYITIGMLAFTLLIPLAVTSTKGWVKRMGGKNWQRLHKLVYIIVPLGCLHFWFMVKGVQLEPIIYGAITLGLLAVRRMPEKKKSRA